MDTMTKSDPEDWSISVDDLRFTYALGLVYGRERAYADRAEAEAEDTDDDTPDDTAEDEPEQEELPQEAD